MTDPIGVATTHARHASRPAQSSPLSPLVLGLTRPRQIKRPASPSHLHQKPFPRSSRSCFHLKHRSRPFPPKHDRPAPSTDDGRLVLEPAERGRTRCHLRVRRMGSPDGCHDEQMEPVLATLRLHTLRSGMASADYELNSATPPQLPNSTLSSSAQSRDAAHANSPPPPQTVPSEIPHLQGCPLHTPRSADPTGFHAPTGYPALGRALEACMEPCWLCEDYEDPIHTCCRALQEHHEEHICARCLRETRGEECRQHPDPFPEFITSST